MPLEVGFTLLRRGITARAHERALLRRRSVQFLLK